jgi:hypothetical protein
VALQHKLDKINHSEHYFLKVVEDLVSGRQALVIQAVLVVVRQAIQLANQHLLLDKEFKDNSQANLELMVLEIQAV